MNLHNAFEEIEKINADEQTKKALLKIIDLKTENDMKEVISEIHNQNAKFDAQNAKFDAQNAKFDAMQAQTQSQIKLVLWVIGIASAVTTLMLAIIALK